MHLSEADSNQRTVEVGKMPYLGQTISLDAQSEQYGHCYQGNVNAPSADDRLVLHVASRQDSKTGYSRQDVLETLQEWLKGRSLQYFTERTRDLSRRSGLAPKKIALTSAGKRWGSCSSNRTIRLNWRLIHLKPVLIEYVIAHEFAHLKQMNHSPAFWAEVRNLMPDYRIHEQAFKDICINDLNIIFNRQTIRS